MIIAAVLPALGIIVYSNYERQRLDIDAIKADALIMMQSLANNHKNDIETTSSFLKTLAKLPVLQNQDAVACNKLFRDLIKENTQYATIYAADRDGKIFANALSSGNISIKQRKYFQDAIKKKALSTGEYTIGQVSRRAVLPFAYPVRDSSGRITGVVAVSLDLEKYGRNFVAVTKFPKGATLNLLDRNTIRLYRHPDNEKYAGKVDLPEIVKHISASPQEGVFTSIGVDGVKRLFAYKRFYLKADASPYLYMRVGIPEEQALALTKTTFLRNIGLLIGSLFAAVLIAWLLGHLLIVKRLNRLVCASRQVGQGDFSARTGIDHRGSELNQLACSFDDMAEALEKKELDRKQAQEALFESEIKFKSFTEQALVGTYLIQDGVFKYVNPKFAQMFGYTVEECLKDMSFEKLTYAEDVAYVKEQIRKRVSGEIESIHYTFRGVKKNGQIFDVEVYGSSSIHKGRIAAAGSIMDISERKQSEQLIEELIHRLEVEKDHALKSARIDGLTGIANRRYLDESLNREFFRLKRGHMALSLIMLDIDYFKKFNDQYGHIAGDDCLCLVATALQNNVNRPADLVARFGGEEFVVILPDTVKEGASIVAERLRTAIEALAIPHDGSENAPYVTVSIGVATILPDRTDRPGSILEIADGALYRAKRNGRNRVEIAVDEVAFQSGVSPAGKGFIQLDWERKNECGNIIIDQQHQRLFDTSNKVFSALIEGKTREEGLSLITRLLDETVEHFHDEEEILFSKGYPLAEDHRLKHDELIRKAKALAEKFNHDTLHLDELFNFIAFDVVSEHMIIEDKKYYPYV